MWRYIGLALVSIIIVIFGFSLVDVGGGTNVNADALLLEADVDLDAYTRATDQNYDWQFPEDHGAHPDFLTEWWYYTGNVATEEGRRFGYQFTVFRRAITPPSPDTTDSEWRTQQIYLAHFTISDIATETFHHDTRFSRGAADLAGAVGSPRYRVWLEDWEVAAADSDTTMLKMSASMDDNTAIDFTLDRTKPPALQGVNGWSPKSEQEGYASYYYSLSRLATEGTITVDGEVYTVSGYSWMDHEFGTEAIAPNAQGWDWFGLIFDDGREMMVGKIRLNDGNVESGFGGLFIYEDGSTTYLEQAAIQFEETDTWTSPHTDATYPAGWQITVDGAAIGESEPLEIAVTPLMSDQELYDTNPIYWEGAVEISGDASGYGYAELTGYVSPMTGFF